MTMVKYCAKLQKYLTECFNLNYFVESCKKLVIIYFISQNMINVFKRTFFINYFFILDSEQSKDLLVLQRFVFFIYLSLLFFYFFKHFLGQSANFTLPNFQGMLSIGHFSQIVLQLCQSKDVSNSFLDNQEKVKVCPKTNTFTVNFS